MKQIQHSTLTRPALAPMDFNAGKPNPKDALFNSGLTLLFVLVAAIGAWISIVFGPRSGESALPMEYNFIGWARAIGLLMGWATAATCIRFALSYGSITEKGWTSYYNRLEDWHTISIAAFRDQGGQEVEDTLTTWELRPTLARDVLAVALCIHREMRLDRATRAYEWPYSTRGLDRSLYLSSESKGNQVLIGSLTGTRPEEVNAIFTQLGLIRGAKPGYAGAWAPRNEGEVIELVASNWNKLGKKYMVEPEVDYD